MGIIATTGNWKEYQQAVAEFFRSIGLQAQTDVTLRGVRTTHAVDVLVDAHYSGFDVTWIVECKQWNSRVSKLHVLALREIVADLGADRGILLAENGFQSGAMEAAVLTNVHITSLADIQKTASGEVFSMRLRELYDRLDAAKKRYWNIPKGRRIEYGLRPDVFESGYSGNHVMDCVDEVLKKAFRGIYPIELDCMSMFGAPQVPRVFSSVEAVVREIEPLIGELEAKLAKCESSK